MMVDWQTLEHAYGNAADMPEVLEQLSPDPQAEVWKDLWSRICHQGTVYSASFAALPVLLSAAEQWPPAQRVQPLLLAACIVSSDDVSGGSRKKLFGPVQWVLPCFIDLCNESLAETRMATEDFVALLQATLFFSGDQFWGEVLELLPNADFPGACPHCDEELVLIIGEDGFFTTVEKWSQPYLSKSTLEPPTEIKQAAIEPNLGELPEVGRRMHEWACAAQQKDVADAIRYLFGTTGCVSCGGTFQVPDALTE